jgi:CRP-like cAMP-binding protein
MTEDSKFPIKNHILRSMPDVVERLGSHLEALDGPLGMPIYDAFKPIEYLYFPDNAMLSIVAGTSTGQLAEIGVSGPEGAVGLEVLMGVDTSPHHSMVQIAGPVRRVKAKIIKEEFDRGEVFQKKILHYQQKLSVQVGQTTLCNRMHVVDERLSRWLLMCHDRIEGDVLLLTQEFISLMLGTSRVVVTRAAKMLQELGYIKYVRGKIAVLDRAGLEDAACECYHIVKNEYDRPYN